ncbi:MAG: hypothetical protein Q4G67_14160, partial [Actinomycetia bacterium]|nr:hypothetical protein [Actinomycetes bacterium]
AQRADLLRDQAGAQDDLVSPGDVVEPVGEGGAGVDGAADEVAGQERGGKDPDGDPSATA